MQQISFNAQDIQSLLFAALIEIFITVLFCRSLIKTLSFIEEPNRKIKPVLIWLLLVPGLKYLLNFAVVFGMSSSIEKELVSRDFEEVKRPTFIPGIIYAVLSLLPIFVFLATVPKQYEEQFALAIGLLGLAQMIFFIQYWMKINWYRLIFRNDESEHPNGDQQ